MAMASPLELCDISSVCITCILCGSQNSCYQIPEDSRDKLITALCCVCDFNLTKDKEAIQWTFFCFGCHEELGRIQEVYETVQVLKRQLERFKEKHKIKLRGLINSLFDISQGSVQISSSDDGSSNSQKVATEEAVTLNTSQNIPTVQVEAELIVGGENDYEDDDDAEVQSAYGNNEGVDYFEEFEIDSVISHHKQNKNGDTEVQLGNKFDLQSSILEDRNNPAIENDVTQVGPSDGVENTAQAVEIESNKNSEHSSKLELLYNTLKAKYCLRECYVKLNFKQKLLVKKVVKKLPGLLCSFPGCGKEFKSKNQREDHYNNQHEGTIGLYNCKECELTFKERSLFRLHVNKHKKKLHECPTCGEKCQSVNQLQKHKRAQHVRKFVCDECAKGFRSETSFKIHRLSHRPERPFQCEFCDKTFKWALSLLEHQRIHPESNLKQFKCKYCDIVLVSERYFKLHEKQHEGQFKFRCDICNYGTFSKTSLNVHVHTHSDTKNFECSVCHLKLKSKTSLKTHKDNVHSESITRNNCCSTCGKLFKFKHTLIRHMQAVHSTERSFCCSSCGKVFALHYYLMSHMRSKHPEQPVPPANLTRKFV